MSAPCIVILTESRYEKPSVDNQYIRNLLFEDNLLADCLKQRGLPTQRVDWARADFDWAQARAAVFRSTWDYFDRFAEFSAWLARVAPLLPTINPAQQIRWNCDKRYLLDLQERGVAVVPTRLIERGSGQSLASLLADASHCDAVLKPAVSGAARHTYRLSANNVDAHEAIFAELIAAEDMLLQPFQKSVLKQGEISLIVIAGQYTHAVHKVGKPGDFRVQDDHGGVVFPHAASAVEIALAERAVAACDPLPAYARVDLVRSNDDRLVVMELELVEPELFFRFEPSAAEKLADEIAKRV
jgi:glutathione synthase/RimK-type ligase-like ATP-grasp enzyme